MRLRVTKQKSGGRGRYTAKGTREECIKENASAEERKRETSRNTQTALPPFSFLQKLRLDMGEGWMKERRSLQTSRNSCPLPTPSAPFSPKPKPNLSPAPASPPAPSNQLPPPNAPSPGLPNPGSSGVVSTPLVDEDEWVDESAGREESTPLDGCA